MQKYKSKIDWWLIIVLILASVILVQSIYINLKTYNLYQNLPYFIFYSLIMVLIWLPITTTYYVVDTKNLKVQSMFFKWEIPLENIHKIEQTSNPLSAPALSLDRIRIKYMQNGSPHSIMVSPKNKAEFIKAISKNISI